MQNQKKSFVTSNIFRCESVKMIDVTKNSDERDPWWPLDFRLSEHISQKSQSGQLQSFPTSLNTKLKIKNNRLNKNEYPECLAQVHISYQLDLYLHPINLCNGRRKKRRKQNDLAKIKYCTYINCPRWWLGLGCGVCKFYVQPNCW